MITNQQVLWISTFPIFAKYQWEFEQVGNGPKSIDQPRDGKCLGEELNDRNKL
jgi:hypothetical protein